MDPHFVGKVAVKALIEHDGKILLIRSHSDRSLWDLPGGRMHFGEKAEESLAREAQEEIGADVVVHELIFTEQVKHISDPAPHLFLTYRASLVHPDAPLKLPTEEVREALWVGRDEMKNYALFDNHIKPVAAFWKNHEHVHKG